jgi:outer membrane protein assembly factor BamB
VHQRRTTICCSSAIALTLLLSAETSAEPDAPAEFGLFPTRLVWTLSLNAALTATPGFASLRGYFPIEGDRLASYDLTDGTLLWIANVKTLSQPVAGNGLVFIVEPDGLTALREDDGSIAWQVLLAEPLAAPLVWDTGWLVAASLSGAVLAFRAADGELIWRYDAGVPVHARPSFGPDHLYVPLDDARLVALRIDTGTPVWQRRLGGAPNDVLAWADRLYVGSNDNFFYCLRTSDGQVDWRWRTGADVIGMPLVENQRVYFVSKDNVLRALDRYSGGQRWKRALPLRPTHGPTRAADALLVTGTASKAPAYSLEDGTPAGEVTGAGELAAAPHVASAKGLPMVTLVTRDIVKGTIVSTVTRSVEPAIVQVAPLPNPEIVTPNPTEVVPNPAEAMPNPTVTPNPATLPATPPSTDQRGARSGRPAQGA